ARRDCYQRRNWRSPEQHSASLQQFGFQEAGGDSSINDVERPDEPAMSSADDLGARRRNLFAARGELGLTAFGEAPLLVVDKTVFGRCQHVPNSAQSIQRYVTNDDAGTRLLKALEKFTISAMH